MSLPNVVIVTFRLPSFDIVPVIMLSVVIVNSIMPHSVIMTVIKPSNHADSCMVNVMMSSVVIVPVSVLNVFLLL